VLVVSLIGLFAEAASLFVFAALYARLLVALAPTDLACGGRASTSDTTEQALCGLFRVGFSLGVAIAVVSAAVGLGMIAVSWRLSRRSRAAWVLALIAQPLTVIAIVVVASNPSVPYREEIVVSGLLLSASTLAALLVGYREFSSPRATVHTATD
jgi:hypothetical protein